MLRTTVMPKRSRRYVVFVVLVSIFGNASLAGATTWTVVLTNGTHPAQSQSNSINAPTGSGDESEVEQPLAQLGEAERRRNALRLSGDPQRFGRAER